MFGLSGAMMLFLAVFFMWNCATALFVLFRYRWGRREKAWFVTHFLLSIVGVALFGMGTVLEIVRILRM